MSDISKALAKALNISLEDNAQVEVNFNIDTDEDGAPIDDAVEGVDLPSDEPTEEEEEMAESEGESDAAEADMDQLQEAQDSLESLGSILHQHNRDGTLTRMGISFYKIALESIVGNEIIQQLEIPTFESRDYTKHHSGLIALESHNQLTHHLNVVSMEAGFNWLKKLRHKLAVFFKGEKALLKRAEGLRTIAQTSKGEQASNDTIDVNHAKGLKLPILLSRKWDSEDQFLTQVKTFNALFNEMAELRDGYSDEFVDNMFPSSNNWPKDAKGGRSYEMFGIKLVRDDLINGHKSTEVTQTANVVNLTPDMCEQVLAEIMNTLRKGNMVRDNIAIMCDICENVKKVEMSTSDTTSQTGNTRDTMVKGSSSTTHTNVTYPDGYIEMMNTLEDLLSLKMKVMTEILNYVNYSLTDREFN